MTLSTLSAPAVEPVSVSEIKDMLRIDADDEDALLGTLIAAARSSVEAFLRRRLITQTVRLTRTGFCEPMLLPVAPIQSVAAVRYVDGAGSTQTMASEGYRLVQSVEPNMLAPVYGQTWPVPRQDHDSVTIDLVVGYGDASSDVPEEIVLAIKMLAGSWYRQREAVQADGRAQEWPLSVRFMLMPRVLWI